MTVTDLHSKVHSMKNREPKGFRLFMQAWKQKSPHPLAGTAAAVSSGARC